MRKRCRVTLGSVLGLVLVLAGAGALVGAEKGNHCFYQVGGEKGRVYLLGSIHFLKKDFYPLDAVIEEAFRGAELVVFETDIAGMSDPALQVKLMMQGMCPAGKTLKDFLSEEGYAEVTKRLGSQAALFDRFRPSMVAMTLAALELQKLGFSPEDGVDHYFHRKAVAEGKAIAPLETVDFQLELFLGLTGKDEEAFLLQTLKESEQIKTLFKEIVEAWKTGNEEGLEKLIHESMEEHPEILKKFLTDRNRAWVPKLQKWMGEGKTVFVVVGAGHLVGKESVVDLLRKAGLRVEQL